MKFDPYKSEEHYLAWKKKVKKGIPLISKENSDLILQYLNDMEMGLNISSKSVKGPRSFISLQKSRQRLIDMAIKFKKYYNLNSLVEIDEDRLIGFSADLRNGKIKKSNGENYRCVRDFVKTYKAFWHWWMKYNKKRGIEIKEITADLDASQEKPDWVYLTEEQVKLLAENSKPYYRALIYFLYDTGIRSPTELMNIMVSDFYNDFRELNIRNEISKTFGRRIKLMLSSELIKEFVKERKLKPSNFIFTKSPPTMNKSLQKKSRKLFGNGISPAGQKYSELTMYDFRHCACCYWLPRYKSESALMYRFGWKKSDKIHYYSELLGMQDTISEEDLKLDKSTKKKEEDSNSPKTEKELFIGILDLMGQQIIKMKELANLLI